MQIFAEYIGVTTLMFVLCYSRLKLSFVLSGFFAGDVLMKIFMQDQV